MSHGDVLNPLAARSAAIDYPESGHPTEEGFEMKIETMFLSAGLLIAADGCHRTPSAAQASGPLTGPIAATAIFDRCQTAPLVAAPAMITGDLTTANADSNDLITVTGYSWAGRDHFIAMNLAAGQSVTFALTEVGGGWDGGIYVFRDCNAIPASTVGGLDTNPTRPYQFTAPAAGRYIVAIDAWQPNTGGRYWLNITQP